MKPKERKKRFDALTDLGCVACQKDGYDGTPPEIHHIRQGYGIGQRAPDEETIPLCPTHHRYGKGQFPGIHSDPNIFKKKYGNERELLAFTNEQLCDGSTSL